MYFWSNSLGFGGPPPAAATANPPSATSGTTSDPASRTDSATTGAPNNTSTATNNTTTTAGTPTTPPTPFAGLAGLNRDTLNQFMSTMVNKLNLSSLRNLFKANNFFQTPHMINSFPYSRYRHWLKTTRQVLLD